MGQYLTTSDIIILSGSSLAIGNSTPNAPLDVSGSGIISGSLKVIQGITGSLFGTSSWAVSSSQTVTAQTASYVVTAQTASYVLQAVSASFATTASYVKNAQTASYYSGSVTSASYASSSTSASYASTASYVVTAQTASYLNTLNQNLTFNGNLTLNGTASITYLNVSYETASVIYSSGSNQFGDASNDTQTLYGSVIIPTGSLTITGSTISTGGFTGSLQGTATTASYVVTAQTASYVLQAVSASYATTASYYGGSVTSASYASSSTSASYAQTASYVVTAQTASYVLQAVSASFATTASYVKNAQTASYVVTAQTASYVLQAVSASFATLAQTANTASYVVTAQTASYVTGSVHNSTNPALSASYALTASYALNAGSGGTVSTASLLTTASVSSNTITFTKGDGSTFPITVATGSGGGSSFPYTGSAIISGSLVVTGSITSTLGFTGSLQGTSSWAVSASQAVTASYVVTAQTASYVLQAVSASYASSSTSSSYSSNSTSASFATTASLPLRGVVTASAVDTTITFTKGDGTTFNVTVSQSGSVATASYALFAEVAATASYVTASNVYGPYGSNSILSSSYASFATTASSALNASDILIYVKNSTGAQINKGKVVRIAGAVGDNPLISTASYTNDNNSANTLGITNENIANDAFGYVMTEGKLLGIDTSTFVDGQLLYLGATGSIIGTAPVAPLHAVRLGQVLRVQLNNGSMYVRIDNGYELGELHDVVDSTTTSSYGDLLVKSGSVWINSKQLTGSYSLTGSLQATSFTGSLQGTSSWATNALTASNIGPSISPDGSNRVLISNGNGTIYTTANLTYTGSTFTVIGGLSNGTDTTTTGLYSHAEGENTISLGSYSHAEGSRTEANGTASHAEGSFIIANGYASHAEGSYTIANGDYSHAEGGGSIANGVASHAEGEFTEANGLYSHTEGSYTIASADYQHAQGMYNISSATPGAFILGNGIGILDRSNLIFAAGNTVQITGSLDVSGSITGSLQGTSSWATNAISASYATTASYVLNAQTASYVQNAQTASYVLQAISASFATTASYALNAGSTVSTASLLTTASAVDNVITFTKGDGSTFPVTVATGSGGGSSFPYTGDAIISGSLVVTGSITATTGFTGSLQGTASYATTASYALNAGGASTNLEATVAWDGNGSFVSTGNTRYVVLPNSGTINGWSIVAIGTSPTITVDVLYQASGTTLPTASIAASALPALSTGNVISSTTLTGWTSSLAAGGVLGFRISASANILQAKIALTYK